MPIYVDNQLIQDCQGVIADNTNMAAVNADNERVYTEVCFSGQWSGDTYTLPFSQVCCPAGPGQHCMDRSTNYGMDTDGNAYRLSTWGGGSDGAWLYADANGLDTGESRIADSLMNRAIVTTPTSIEWNCIPVGPYDEVTHSGSVTFDKGNGFSGTQEAVLTLRSVMEYTNSVRLYRWETSSGQLRFYEKIYNGSCVFYEGTGQWITLT